MIRKFLFILSVCISPLSFAGDCDFDKVSFDKNFPTGRFSSCEQLSTNRYLLTLTPENTPINDSPWYAFKVDAQQEQTIEVVLKVTGGQHRYPPKVSDDGKRWRLQEYRIRKDRMTMKINVSNQPTWISAQEIITSADYVSWGDKLATKQNTRQDILGWSEQNRALFKIEYQGEGNEWLVILGRQHPPEVTGALALLPFSEAVLADNKLANRFRDRFNILVIPNINPDGVFMGNWRHNANGVDLNRDWKTFKQKEVASIHQYLQQLTAQGQKIAMGVDFHSTHKDIFYTMPEDYGVENPMLVTQWLNALDEEFSDFVVIQKPGNNPDKGVSKQYFADVHKVPAITYEMGDNTDRVFINQLAESAANQLMNAMLQTPKPNTK